MSISSIHAALAAKHRRRGLEAAVLEVAHPGLHLSVATVAQPEVDEVSFAVGEHDGVAHTVVVLQAQRGSGVK